jgi:uncharacterized phage infection (PIP) family protein YhgE
MQQIQQLTAERIQLQSDNTKLKSEVDDLKKQLQQATSGKAALEAKAKNLEVAAGRNEASSKDSTEQLEKSRAQLQEVIGKFRETTQTLRDIETDRNEKKTQLAQRDVAFKQCVDRNAGLYTLGSEILDKLEHRGVWDAMKGAEPFTKLSRTRLENLIDDYRYRVDELKQPADAKKIAQQTAK